MEGDRTFFKKMLCGGFPFSIAGLIIFLFLIVVFTIVTKQKCC